MKIFCYENHDVPSWRDLRQIRKEFESKLLEEKHLLVSNACEKLASIGEKEIGLAVKVETDNSGAIKIIKARMKGAVADKLLGEARRELMKLL